ncbi:MAG TPA: Pycsar system effector family protein [Moraxellaceae bacterium]
MSKPNLEPLIGIYLTVKDSLEFAEKKNAIITAFISSIIFAVFRYASDTWLMDYLVTRIYLAEFLVFLFLGLLTAIFSFLPQTRRFWDFADRRALESSNLLYFGDLERISPKTLVDFLFPEGSASAQEAKLRYDYAQQVVINSFIATRKYFLSRMAIWMAVCALLTPLLGLPLFFALDPQSPWVKRRLRPGSVMDQERAAVLAAAAELKAGS